MMFCGSLQEVLDLSTKIKTDDPLQETNCPSYIRWNNNRLTLKMALSSHSPRLDHEVSDETLKMALSSHSPRLDHEASDEGSRSFSSVSDNTTVGYGSPQSSPESLEPCTKPAKRRPSRVEIKDETYLERRRKNNLAAKKSRDAKREREKLTKKKIIILEEENIRLKRALKNCACGSALKNQAVFLPTAYNFPIPYAESRFIPVRTELR